MPKEIDDGNLGALAASLMSLTNTQVAAADLDKCHRLQNESTVIVEFKTRTMRDSVVRGRKLLKNKTVAIEELGLSRSFINESLCPEYRKLDFVCRKLKKNDIIADTWFFNGRLFVVDKTGKKWFVSHMNDALKFASKEVIASYFKRN